MYLLAKLRKKYGYSNKNVQNNSYSYSSNTVSQSQNSNSTDQVNGVDDQNQVANADNLDYEQLIKDLRLDMSENRFSILLHLPHQQLVALLQVLGKVRILIVPV